MQVSLETTSGLERRLIVGVPSERVEKEIEQRLQKAAKTVRLDGFRKGKVPLKVVRQRFGSGVRQEVVGELINSTFFEALQQKQIQPAGQPSIEPVKNEDGADLEYIATFEVYPEIELVDLSSLSIVKDVATIEDDDIDKMIHVIRQQQANYVQVDRAAADGDQVNIDYLGTLDGEEFEGGKAEGSDLVLGSGQMIPGFEEGIIGLKAGDKKSLSLTFPEDYHAEELKGQNVEFAVTVNKVSEQQLPELDNEFFAKFGVEEGGVDEFRIEVKANMQRELNNALDNKLKGRIVEQLLQSHDFSVPASLVKNEISSMKRQMLSQFGDNAQFDESMLPDDLFTEKAERRVRSGLIFSEIAKANEIRPDAKKVKEKIEALAETYDQPEEVIQYYYSNQELLASVESLVAEDAIVEHIAGGMQVTEQQVSYEEGIKPDPQDPSE